MAAGVNYNLVWAAMGKPVSIFRYTGDDFHIGGSDASGIVAAVGPGVKRWQPGDEVVIHCNQSCGECPECNGLDPMARAEQKIWGYETNWGSFAQFTKVSAKAHRSEPVLGRLVGLRSSYFTAYRMLIDRASSSPGNVLIWGAAGASASSPRCARRGRQRGGRRVIGREGQAVSGSACPGTSTTPTSAT
jgi:crotonyl-CoA carboxylase/reductase